MNNIIPPIQPVSPQNTSSDNSLTAVVDGKNLDLSSLKIGDNVVLQLRAMSTGMMLAALKSDNPQAPDIDLSLSLNKNIDLPKNAAVDIRAKVIMQSPTAPELKIISINGQKPEVFIKTETLSQTDSAPRATVPTTSAPILRPSVNTDSSSLKVAPQAPAEQTASPQSPINITPQKVHIPLEPLKLANVLESFIKTLPQGIQGQITEQLQNIQIRPELKIISDNSSAQQNVVTDLTKTFPDIKTAFDNLSSQVSGKPSSEAIALIEKFVETLKPQLPVLLGKDFPTQQIIKDNNIFLKSELGSIFPEQNLKLSADAKIFVTLQEILNLPKIEAKNTETNITKTFLDVLKPLNTPQKSEVYQQIINKLPAGNEKMLSNIVSYIKASTEQKVELWLGKDVVAKLNSLGAEGREIVAKLDNLILPKPQEQQAWRIIEIPFFNQENLAQIKIAIKNMQDDAENDNQPDKKNNKAARFVVDTTFTALGSFQFDGFSIPQEKRFDLIIRTQKDMDEDFISSVMQIFRHSLAEVDYAGNIKINVKENFIKIFDDDRNETTLPNGIFI